MKEHVTTISSLTYQFIPDGLELLRTSLREIVETVNSSMVHSYTNLMDFRFGPMTGREGKAPPGFAFQRTIREDDLSTHLVPSSIRTLALWVLALSVRSVSLLSLGTIVEPPRKGTWNVHSTYCVFTTYVLCKKTTKNGFSIRALKTGRPRAEHCFFFCVFFLHNNKIHVDWTYWCS